MASRASTPAVGRCAACSLEPLVTGATPADLPGDPPMLCERLMHLTTAQGLAPAGERLDIR
jgi:hypothetical protein